MKSDRSHAEGAPPLLACGESWGEGDSPKTEILESPSHPDRIWRCDPTSPRKRGEMNRTRGGTSYAASLCAAMIWSAVRPVTSAI
jgi:hypothetical protein